jgi:hypothetical protein
MRRCATSLKWTTPARGARAAQRPGSPPRRSTCGAGARGRGAPRFARPRPPLCAPTLMRPRSGANQDGGCGALLAAGGGGVECGPSGGGGGGGGGCGGCSAGNAPDGQAAAAEPSGQHSGACEAMDADVVEAGGDALGEASAAAAAAAAAEAGEATPAGTAPGTPGPAPVDPERCVRPDTACAAARTAGQRPWSRFRLHRPPMQLWPSCEPSSCTAALDPAGSCIASKKRPRHVLAHRPTASQLCDRHRGALPGGAVARQLVRRAAAVWRHVQGRRPAGGQGMLCRPKCPHAGARAHLGTPWRARCYPALPHLTPPPPPPLPPGPWTCLRYGPRCTAATSAACTARCEGVQGAWTPR